MESRSGSMRHVPNLALNRAQISIGQIKTRDFSLIRFRKLSQCSDCFIVGGAWARGRYPGRPARRFWIRRRSPKSSWHRTDRTIAEKLRGFNRPGVAFFSVSVVTTLEKLGDLVRGKWSFRLCELSMQIRQQNNLNCITENNITYYRGDARFIQTLRLISYSANFLVLTSWIENAELGISLSQTTARKLSTSLTSDDTMPSNLLHLFTTSFL